MQKNVMKTNVKPKLSIFFQIFKVLTSESDCLRQNNSKQISVVSFHYLQKQSC